MTKQQDSKASAGALSNYPGPNGQPSLKLPEKQCKACGEVKPLADFYPRYDRPWEYQGICKVCWNKRQKDRIKDPEVRKATLRKYNHSDKGAAAYKRGKENHPDRIKARTTLNNAIRDGKLIRGICFCGALAEAHHEDYSKPLEVEWLCTKHHKVHHNKRKELK